MDTPEPVRILIADDHPLFRDALRQVAVAAAEPVACVEASDFDDVLALVDDGYDLVLLDLHMPGMGALTGLTALRDAAPSVPLVVVTADETPAVVQAILAAGAAGYFPKFLPRDAMVDAVRRVLAGEIYMPGLPARCAAAETLEGLGALTATQRRVLEMMVLGRSNKEIAQALRITVRTVKAHVSEVLRKLRMASRTQILTHLMGGAGGAPPRA